MIKEEILGGLKSAISKGESLQKAMTTFYNAGYKREEIEEAAKAFQQEKVQQKQIPVANKLQEPKEVKKIKPLPKSSKKISDYGKPASKPIPNVPVSQYGEPPKKKKAGKWLLILIILAGLIFVGLLIAFLMSA